MLFISFIGSDAHHGYYNFNMFSFPTKNGQFNRNLYTNIISKQGSGSDWKRQSNKQKKLCTFLLFIWKVHLIGSFQNQHIVVVPSHFEFILFDFVLINTQFLFNYVSVMYGLVFGWRNHAEGLWTYVEALYSSKWILRTNVIHSSERQAKKNVLAVLSCVCVCRFLIERVFSCSIELNMHQ